MTKYFIYCRKSSEEEERQMLSIEAQLTELREYAKHNNLFIAKEFHESKTAKEPGREVFNDMLAEIEKGNASGILAWNPDRLARNSVDGGRVIYLVDTGKIESLKFPTFWFEATPQGKFMLSVAFGQAKYSYIVKFMLAFFFSDRIHPLSQWRKSVHRVFDSLHKWYDDMISPRLSFSRRRLSYQDQIAWIHSQP